MGVFKLPFSDCDELTRMVRGFYWGSSKGKRKVHWCAWDELLQLKNKGGACFRDFRLFDQALFAQQDWRLMSKLESLYAQVLKAKYYPEGSSRTQSLPRMPRHHGRQLATGWSY